MSKINPGFVNWVADKFVIKGSIQRGAIWFVACTVTPLVVDRVCFHSEDPEKRKRIQLRDFIKYLVTGLNGTAIRLIFEKVGEKLSKGEIVNKEDFLGKALHFIPNTFKTAINENVKKKNLVGEAARLEKIALSGKVGDVAGAVAAIISVVALDAPLVSRLIKLLMNKFAPVPDEKMHKKEWKGAKA